MKTVKLLSIIALISLVAACSSDEDNFMLNSQDLNTTIDENPANGVSLGTITTNATAPTFSITSQSPSGAFAVSATGQVSVANASLFDYETQPNPTATISVMENGLESFSIVNVTLNDVDDIASFLSTTKAGYEAATAGDWVEVTEAEYDALAASLNEVSKSAIPDSLYESDPTTLSNGANNFTLAPEGGETLTMPDGSYLFAFKYVSKTDAERTMDQVKVSSTSAAEDFMDMGNLLPSHMGQGVHYFVLKGSDSPTTATGHLGFYSSTTSGYRNLDGISNRYASGNVNALPSTENINYMFQGLSSTQKQWE